MSKNSFLFGSRQSSSSKSTAKTAGSFKTAIQNTPVRVTTTNGAATFESSLNPLVDLFFVIGASRGKDITVLFEKALQYDTEKALRMLFWCRDVRQGSGERQTFRSLMSYLEQHHAHLCKKLVLLIPEYGRFDDLLMFSSDELRQIAFTVIKAHLEAKNGLCAKWMPRKGANAAQLRQFLGWSPKFYRKTLVNLTKVVESQMCAKQWTEINYSHVPSVAAARYQKAFSKHDPAGYKAYRDALNSPNEILRSTVKVNASAIFPHDVLKGLVRGDVGVATAQWEALPNYLGDNKIIPMLDVSGSMGTWGSTSHYVTSIAPIDIAVSLGLYVADKQSGPFKDIALTFSTTSKIEVLKGDISSKIRQINKMHWDGTTNIESGFKAILKVAVENKVAPADMPKMLLIISDMEFDQCTKGTAFETAAEMFSQAGYTLPKVVFWNVNGRPGGGNNPVTFKTNGTALISGYSPSILKSVLSGDLEAYTPESVMNETIMSSRYAAVGMALLC